MSACLHPDAFASLLCMDRVQSWSIFLMPLTKTLQQRGLKEILIGHRHAGEVFELFGLWYELVRILMYVA